MKPVQTSIEEGFRIIVCDGDHIEVVDEYLDDVAGIVAAYGDHPRLFVDVECAEQLALRLLDAVAIAREHLVC